MLKIKNNAGEAYGDEIYSIKALDIFLCSENKKWSFQNKFIMALSQGKKEGFSI